MSSLTDALESKISALEDEVEELEDALDQANAKLLVYKELLADETGEPVPKIQLPQPPNPPAMTGKKRGRPKGSKNKKSAPKKDKKVKEVDPDALALYEEAVALGGEHAKTDPELAERLKNRFRPFPRSQPGYGSAKVGSDKGQPDNQSDKTISMPDDVALEEE